MSKQQMAEWLAINVLDWKLFKNKRGWDCSANEPSDMESSHKYIIAKNLCDVIYSPCGFFAVWDAVEKNYHSIGFWHAKPGRIGCGISSLDKSDLYYTGEGYGKDRYECFYNAVYEAYGAIDRQ